MRRAAAAAAAATVWAATATALHADPYNCSQLPAAAFERITLTNNVPGMNVSFVPYGATLTNFYVPDRAGTPRDVALGFDDATLYCSAMVNGSAAHPYFGAAIGRVAIDFPAAPRPAAAMPSRCRSGMGPGDPPLEDR